MLHPNEVRVGRREVIIKTTHRGLWYEDGVLKRVLEAGRYVIPRYFNLGFYRRPKVEVVLVDIRERELTIKGQEILTADKVAVRVSIIVQFRITDPQLAVHGRAAGRTPVAGLDDARGDPDQPEPPERGDPARCPGDRRELRRGDRAG